MSRCSVSWVSQIMSKRICRDHLLARLYRYTGDRARLQAQWPTLKSALAYLKAQRKAQRTAANLAPDRRMLYGLMPSSISDEGYSAQRQYSLWYDFWALTGYKDATYAAHVLNIPDAAAIVGWRDQFATDLHAAIAASVRHWGIDYIPGATSLGDFDATSKMVALDPAHNCDGLDVRLLRNTFERLLRLMDPAGRDDRRNGEPASWISDTVSAQRPTRRRNG